MADCEHMLSADSLENIKRYVISRFKGSSQCVSVKTGIHLIKRNKNLHKGDFQIILPHVKKTKTKRSHITDPFLQQPTCDLEDQPTPSSSTVSASPADSGTGLPAKIKLDCLKTGKPSISSPVTFRGEEDGTVMVSLFRPLIWQEAIRVVSQDKDRFGKKILTKTAVINCVKFVSKNFGVNFTIYQLRSIVLAEHIKMLLTANGGFLLSQGYEASILDFNKALRSDGHLVRLLTQERNVSVELSHEDSIKCKDSLRSSEYYSEEENKSRDNVLFIDIGAFIENKQMNFFDKNIKLFNVEKDDQTFDQLQSLLKVSQLKEPDLFIHVVPFEQNFVQQQIDLALRILLKSDTSQIHNVYGSVISRGNTSQVPDANTFYELRRIELKEAFLMKYGKPVEGSSWEDTINAITIAVIKFELLSTACRQTLKVEVNDREQGSGSIDGKGGVFVLYNCARLANLFHNYESAVETGMYPPLPVVTSIDFSLLKDEDEWALLWNYIIVFPELVRDTGSDIGKNNPKLGIHTHKICQFLLDLSRDLSSYYSRTHVLCEPQSHLFPLMHARLHLLKATQQVFHNALDLLRISPVTQL